MWRSLLISILLCQLGPAAELVLNDLRLAWSYQPTSFDYTLRDNGILGSEATTTSGADEFASVWSLEWRGLRSFSGAGRRGGLIAGVGLLATWYQYENAGDLQIASGELMGGYAYAIDDRWTLHCLAVAALGYGQLELANPNADQDLRFTGPVWDYGAEIGASYRLARRWRLLGGLGWRKRTGALTEGDFELDLTSSGLVGTIGVAVILDPEPRRIE